MTSVINVVAIALMTMQAIFAALFSLYIIPPTKKARRFRRADLSVCSSVWYYPSWKGGE